MDADVRNPREVELDVRLRQIHTGALEAVQRNGELLQVLEILCWKYDTVLRWSPHADAN
jgi:hypothetical protein